MLASTVPFWREKKTDEAAKMAKDAVSKLDALDKVLSADAVDSAAAADALRQVAATCATCHTAYREGDPQIGYRIKEGTF
jgi:cytochrome c556